MNHAYADGSQQGETGGWGVVLLVPGLPDAHHRGLAHIHDNGACELLAVLQAVRLAPEGQPLTVHTDATVVVQAVKRGTQHPDQAELGARVRQLAHQRGIRLSVTLGPRDARRMREAHQLATDARLGVPPKESERPSVRVRVRRVAWGAQVTFTLRRGGHTGRWMEELPPRAGVPPALLALAALLAHAQDGEHLIVRMESALAPLAWANPALTPDPAARTLVEEARAGAQARGITLEFA